MHKRQPPVLNTRLELDIMSVNSYFHAVVIFGHLYYASHNYPKARHQVGDQSFPNTGGSTHHTGYSTIRHSLYGPDVKSFRQFGGGCAGTPAENR